MTMQGGTGTLIGTAPQVGDFAFLALWSEFPNTHELAGQAFLDMVGIFFTPDARVLYRGTGVQHQIQAQFVARKLTVQGEGVLKVSPSCDSAVKIRSTWCNSSADGSTQAVGTPTQSAEVPEGH